MREYNLVSYFSIIIFGSLFCRFVQSEVSDRGFSLPGETNVSERYNWGRPGAGRGLDFGPALQEDFPQDNSPSYRTSLGGLLLKKNIFSHFIAKINENFILKNPLTPEGRCSRFGGKFCIFNSKCYSQTFADTNYLDAILVCKNLHIGSKLWEGPMSKNLLDCIGVDYGTYFVGPPVITNPTGGCPSLFYGEDFVDEDLSACQVDFLQGFICEMFV
ncbi:UNVERIFIED_CONTAM: hypothetical protein RMT77_004104 [Armadillidium vulgare]